MTAGESAMRPPTASTTMKGTKPRGERHLESPQVGSTMEDAAESSRALAGSFSGGSPSSMVTSTDTSSSLPVGCSVVHEASPHSP